MEVHHIGLTSMLGLAAKPIIDLMSIVTNLTDLDWKKLHIIALGLEWQGDLASRHAACPAWRSATIFCLEHTAPTLMR